jgi:hypothetical protein
MAPHLWINASDRLTGSIFILFSNGASSLSKRRQGFCLMLANKKKKIFKEDIECRSHY